jgi:hypothetical protein
LAEITGAMTRIREEQEARAGRITDLQRLYERLPDDEDLAREISRLQRLYRQRQRRLDVLERSRRAAQLQVSGLEGSVATYRQAQATAGVSIRIVEVRLMKLQLQKSYEKMK